jgi:hypothetical protein
MYVCVYPCIHLASKETSQAFASFKSNPSGDQNQEKLFYSQKTGIVEKKKKKKKKKNNKKETS